MTDISMRAPGLVERDFRVGRVFNRAASVLSRNFVPFVAIAAVAALPNLWRTTAIGGSAAVAARGAHNPYAPVLTVFGLVMLGLISFGISQAAILNAAYQDMSGRPSPIGESLRKGLRRFLPIIGLAILQGLGIFIASVFLLFPGFIVMAMWFVSLPACVVERLGPIGSLGRSRALTKGHRWKIFGIVVLLTIVNFIGIGVIMALIGISPMRPVGYPLVYGVATWIWGSLIGAFQATVAVVSYYELRAAKEGIDIEQIVAVFD